VEDALRDSEQRYRAFIESSPDACWRIEFDESIDIDLPEEEQIARIFRSGRVAECNEALLQRLGLERDAVIGTKISEVLLDLESSRDAVRSVIRSGYRHKTAERTTVDHAGKRRHIVSSYWAIVED
jgi:PAS domain-containing protein